MNWYQPTLDLTVATCGICGVETEYDGEVWKCQACREDNREDN